VRNLEIMTNIAQTFAFVLLDEGKRRIPKKFSKACF